MKAINSAMTTVLLAGLAWGQAAPASKPAAPAAKPAAPAAKSAAPAVKPAAPAARSPFKAPAVAAKPKAAAKAKATAAAAPAPEMARPTGKRDPFVSPIVRAGSGPAVPCGTGKKCLNVGEVVLQGVVKSQGGMIAVVVNNAKKTYFLRENDPVFNGYVVKITGDSVVFREQATDNMGKPVSREVVKKVAPPA